MTNYTQHNMTQKSIMKTQLDLMKTSLMRVEICNMRKLLILFCITIMNLAWSQNILIPMDENQQNHLKAYGLAYFILENKLDVDWLLNYRGGSFMFPFLDEIEKECIYRGISYEKISSKEVNSILTQIASPQNNYDVIKLEKAPKIAVYSPKNKQPWDDAVTLVFNYAEIKYDIIYDQEILNNLLPLYDWLHLHHEDFTGQYGKFYRSFKNAPWYIEQKNLFEKEAEEQGFNKVSKQKLSVVQKIKEYTAGGGFLFAMCSATDTYDIALSAADTDICEYMFDGDPIDKNGEQKLYFSECCVHKLNLILKDGA